MFIRTYCKNPADYGVEAQINENHYESLNFGFINFNNFFNACLSNLTFLTFTGWGLTLNIVFFSIL